MTNSYKLSSTRTLLGLFTIVLCLVEGWFQWNLLVELASVELEQLQEQLPIITSLLGSASDEHSWSQRRSDAGHDNAGSERTSSKTPRLFHSKPLQVIRDYQKYHSKSVLLQEYENGGIWNRTFVLGFYACPDSAGNRLHEFFNAFIMAVAMNITITWKFFDEMTCRAVGNRAPIKWCRGLNAYNSIERCEELIHRADWIVSFDDLAEKLQLTFGKRDKLKDFYSPEHTMDYSGKPVHILQGNKVWLPKERNLPLELYEQGQRWIESMDAACKQRLDDLYSLGTYYLYGLLFHEIFPFVEGIRPRSDLVGNNSTRDDDDDDENDHDHHDVVSIVLHSRHYKDHINGSDTTYEKKCIQNITRQHEWMGSNLDNCRIYLLSDRNTTLMDLRNYVLQETKCIPVIADHESEDGKFVEHGPFALKGYFQDLALAAHANGGFIGNLRTTKSSSSALVQILYEYNHVVQHGGNVMGKPPPVLCGLPKNRGWGELIF